MQFDGDYIELSFINSKLGYREFFQNFIELLFNLGLKYEGKYYYHNSSLEADYFPQGILDYPLESKACTKFDLLTDLKNKDINIVQVDFSFLKTNKVKLSYLSIFETDGSNILPLSLRIFSDDYFGFESFDEKTIVGKIEKTFKELVVGLKADIAVITDEAWPLPSLYEISLDSSAMCFRDFYAKNQYIKKLKFTNQVSVDNTIDGKFIFSSPRHCKNTKGISSYEQAEEFGLGVSQIISCNI